MKKIAFLLWFFVPLFWITAQNIQYGFSTISLGLSLKEAKASLKLDPLFLYSGDPEVQFVPGTEQKLIRVVGTSYIDYAIFQFESDRLFSINIAIRSNVIDFFSVYTTLEKKYGEPVSFHPDLIKWSDEKTLLTLEKPLQVKYIDIAVYNYLLKSGKRSESFIEYSRDNFLELF
jgi:hypothetical protein